AIRKGERQPRITERRGELVCRNVQAVIVAHNASSYLNERRSIPVRAVADRISLAPDVGLTAPLLPAGLHGGYGRIEGGVAVSCRVEPDHERPQLTVDLP